jgi:hypothetical protein
MKSVVAVVTGINASPEPVQATVDAVTTTIQLCGPAQVAEGELVRGATIQSPIDAVATNIQAMLDAVAAIVMHARLGGGCGQAHGQGQG